MFKKIKEALDKFISDKDDELIMPSLEFVQDLFKMQDVNKWLLYNAITQEQADRAIRFEVHLQEQISKLYVPEYESTNA